MVKRTAFENQPAPIVDCLPNSYCFDQEGTAMKSVASGDHRIGVVHLRSSWNLSLVVARLSFGFADWVSIARALPAVPDRTTEGT